VSSIYPAVLILILLSGCALKLPDPGARHWTTRHASNHFDRAMLDAKSHCAGMGLQAKHLGSDVIPAVTALVLSRFECSGN
jgi:hypothetical protein